MTVYRETVTVFEDIWGLHLQIRSTQLGSSPHASLFEQWHLHHHHARGPKKLWSRRIAWVTGGCKFSFPCAYARYGCSDGTCNSPCTRRTRRACSNDRACARARVPWFVICKPTRAPVTPDITRAPLVEGMSCSIARVSRYAPTRSAHASRARRSVQGCGQGRAQEKAQLRGAGQERQRGDQAQLALEPAPRQGACPLIRQDRACVTGVQARGSRDERAHAAGSDTALSHTHTPHTPHNSPAPTTGTPNTSATPGHMPAGLISRCCLGGLYFITSTVP